jgi:hypothetical protein
MLTRGPGQRAFLVFGSPWQDAVATVRDPGRDGDPWVCAGDFCPGDILVTLLDTAPRAVLCVERLAAGGDGEDDLVVAERRVLAGLPWAAQIEAYAERRFPDLPGKIRARDADRLLAAVAAYANVPITAPESCARGEVGMAWVLLHAPPSCGLCDTAVDPGAEDTGIYPALPEDAGEDTSALLCPACSEEVSHSKHLTLVRHRFVEHHPQCPKCAAWQAQRIVYGLRNTSGPLSDQPWHAAGGCCVDNTSPMWHCRACGHEWELLNPAEGVSPRVAEAVVPLWRRHTDTRTVIARKRPGSDTFHPVTILLAPLYPKDFMREVARIVETTFGGDWDAALAVIADRDDSYWEFLDASVNEHSESIAHIAREIPYDGTPTHTVVPGVGVTTTWEGFDHINGDAVIDGDSNNWYSTNYAYLVENDGTAHVLYAQREAEDDPGDYDTLWTRETILSPADYARRPGGGGVTPAPPRNLGVVL